MSLLPRCIRYWLNVLLGVVLLSKILGIEHPIICGAMYPCSNPELVAAASEAGAIGIVQPVSMVFVYRHEFRAGLRLIRSLTSKPIGLNVIVEGPLRSILSAHGNG